MMRRPAIATAFTALNKAVMQNEGRVTSELKRLIGHIASTTAVCRYCEAHTIRAAERFGKLENEDQRKMQGRLVQVWQYNTSALFTDAEKAALEFARAAASVPNDVTETIQINLRKHWDDGEIVEITGVIALFGYLNRWNDSMGTTLEDAAKADGEQWLAHRGWEAGKHGFGSS
jgi:alkylhydroperoxidase family enzyme